VGNDNTPASWASAPAPTSITVRAGAGLGGSNRITIIWADGAIKNQWLQVTAKTSLGLAAADVFYFGNAVGETGNSASNAQVNSTDEIGARSNPKTFLNPALVNDPYDFNRDGFVNATDQIIARSNSTTLAGALKLITVPASADGMSSAAAGLTLADSSALAAGVQLSQATVSSQLPGLTVQGAVPASTPTAKAAAAASARQEALCALASDDEPTSLPADDGSLASDTLADFDADLVDLLASEQSSR
jgi:hypothetical protein